MSVNEIQDAIGGAFVYMELAKSKCINVGNEALTPGMVTKEQWQRWFMQITMADNDLAIARGELKRLAEKFAGNIKVAS